MNKSLKRYFSVLRGIGLDEISHPVSSLRKAKKILLSKPRSRYLARVFRNLYRFEEPEKWVFIVGCYNSGTTLLEKILGQHPKISTLDEGVFLTDQLRAPEEFGWTRMWFKVLDKIKLDRYDSSVDVAEIKNDWGVFFDLNKEVYLEKSISNSARMLWLQENFDNSYFIFIVRNGYAASEGIRRKAGKGRGSIPDEFDGVYPINLCAKQWVESNRLIEDASTEVDRFERIKYEDLCKSPQKEISKVLKFLDLEDMNLRSDKKWGIQEKQEKIKNMNPRSFRNLSTEDINRINEVAKEMLNCYGYKIF